MTEYLSILKIKPGYSLTAMSWQNYHPLPTSVSVHFDMCLLTICAGILLDRENNLLGLLFECRCTFNFNFRHTRMNETRWQAITLFRLNN